jgi:hypothetical protein
MRTKALYSVQPRRENLGIATKSTVFCPAAAKLFGIATKSTVFCSRKALELCARRKKFELRTKAHCILLSRAAKILEFSNKNNLNWLHFVLPRNQKFRNLSTEAIQICSAAQRKILEFANKNSSN